MGKLLTLAPAIASAGDLLEMRHGAAGTACVGDGGTKATKNLPKWQPELGGDKTRKAWKTLVNSGTPGCDAVADWLVAGAAGEDDAGIADAAAILIKNGTDAHAEAGLSALEEGSLEVTLAILGALEYRLAVVSPELTAAIVDNGGDGVHKAAAAVFIGYHSEGTLKFVYGVPYWDEIAYWGAVTAPPQHYVDAVGKLFDAAEGDTLEALVKYCGRHFREGHRDQDAWAPFLIAHLGDSGDAQGVANIAAKHLAWGEPAGIDEGVDAALAAANKETLEHMLDGFEERLGEKRGTAQTIALLDKIAAGGDGKGQYKRAEKLAKKWRKKV